MTHLTAWPTRDARTGALTEIYDAVRAVARRISPAHRPISLSPMLYVPRHPVDPQTDAEARALRTIAELIKNDRRVIPDHRVAGQLGEVLRACANELGAGRGLPVPVRRAVRHFANAVRVVLDPRNDNHTQT